MIVHIIDQEFKIKNTAANDSQKYKIVGDRVTINENCSCEVEIQYKGRFSDLCNAGDFLFFPSRDVYSSFFQIISCDVDYFAKTAKLYGDSNLLWLYSQVAYSGGMYGRKYGRASEIGRDIEWFLDEFISNARFKYTIKTNEIAGAVMAGDTTGTTAKEALQKTAELFNCEISFSYLLESGTVNGYIEIYEKRNGRETGELLTVGKELSELSKTEDVSGVVTSAYVRGGVKASKRYTNTAEMIADEDLERGETIIADNVPYHNMVLTTAANMLSIKDPSMVYKYNGSYYRMNPLTRTVETVQGYKTEYGFAMRLTSSTIGQEDFVYTYLPTNYDDGDYYVNTNRLISRSAWGRFGAPSIGASLTGLGAEIAYKSEDLETVEQNTILQSAIAILEEFKHPVVTFDCKCNKRVSYGAYYTLVVPDEGVSISARCLSIEESETAGTYIPTFGNYVVKENAFEIMAKNAK